jgi:opacity protein-like surface antigen
MKMSKIVIAVLLMAALPMSFAFGQRAAGQFSIGGFGGVGLPMGPSEFKDNWKMGIGFGGEIKYQLTDMTGLAASFTLQPFKINEDAFADEMGVNLDDYTIEIDGGDVKVNIMSANLIQYFTPPSAGIGLYLTAGGGYYQFSFDDVTARVLYQGEVVIEQTVDVNESENKMGLNGGLGLEMTLGSNLFLFAEGKYHYVFTESDKTSFITGMAGIRFAP